MKKIGLCSLLMAISLCATAQTAKETPADAVDLGLSVKWASHNVGARKAEDYGDYYAWGDTETKSTYNWKTANSSGKIVNDRHRLDPDYDVAHVKWGGTWRMPTKLEQDELCKKCTWKWTSQIGVNGYLVTGPNGNSIFLPAAGSIVDRTLQDVGRWGGYWSSSIYWEDSSQAMSINFHSKYVNDGVHSRRCFGKSVRPVCP